MKIQTLSVVIGTAACPARCPFCVSKMTSDITKHMELGRINWRNFEIACRFAKDSGVSTVLFTGKGEPTLYPGNINDNLEHIQPFEFPFIELQTNGLLFAGDTARKYEEYLKHWYDLGLTTICLSNVGTSRTFGQKIYTGSGREYFYMEEMVSDLHSLGYTVRLTTVMVKGGIDSYKRVEDLVRWCKANKVGQLTVRPVARPSNSHNEKAAEWVEKNRPSDEVMRNVADHLEFNGTLLMKLGHGAKVYDLYGQNVCLNNCLTLDPADNELRQLIFFPDGKLCYDWQYPGARIL